MLLMPGWWLVALHGNMAGHRITHAQQAMEEPPANSTEPENQVGFLTGCAPPEPARQRPAQAIGFAGHPGTTLTLAAM